MLVYLGCSPVTHTHAHTLAYIDTYILFEEMELSSTSVFARTPSLISLQYFFILSNVLLSSFLFSVRFPFNPCSGKEDKGLSPLTLTKNHRSTEYKEMIIYGHIIWLGCHHQRPTYKVALLVWASEDVKSAQ